MEIVKVILNRIRFIQFIPRSVLFCLIMLSRNRMWTHMPPVVILFVCIDSNSLCNRAKLTSQALVEEHWTVSGLWFRREARERANTRALASTRETLISSRVACLPSLAWVFCPPFCRSLKLETTRSLKEVRPLEFPKKHGQDFRNRSDAYDVIATASVYQNKEMAAISDPRSVVLFYDIGTRVIFLLKSKFWRGKSLFFQQISWFLVDYSVSSLVSVNFPQLKLITQTLTSPNTIKQPM